MDESKKANSENTEARQADMDQIEQLGSVTTGGPGDNVHCIVIVGQIEGHQVLPSQNKTTKYEHVMPQLAAIEESREIDGLLVMLNTVGGDIEAGLGIAELISGMKKPTVSLVLGGGHSIGVPLAVSAKRSFIVPSAAMTIHPVRLNGMIIGVPQTFNYFERIQDRIVKFVTSNSNISEEKFLELMLNTGELAADVGTVIDGNQAVELGLIDRLGGLSDALEELHKMIEENRRANEAEGRYHQGHEPQSPGSNDEENTKNPPAKGGKRHEKSEDKCGSRKKKTGAVALDEEGK
mgnify:CR=1 FL=1